MQSEIPDWWLGTVCLLRGCKTKLNLFYGLVQNVKHIRPQRSVFNCGEKNNNNPGNNGCDVIGATYLDHTSTLVHMNIGVAHTGVAHSVRWSFGLWFCSSAAHCCQSSSSAPAWPRSKITHYYQLIYTFIYIFKWSSEEKLYQQHTCSTHTQPVVYTALYCLFLAHFRVKWGKHKYNIKSEVCFEV